MGFIDQLRSLFGTTEEKSKKEPGKETKTSAYGAAAVAQVFRGADFPMSKQDIMEKYGDKEIEYHLGKRERLRDVLSEVPDETFNSTVDLEHALHESIEKHK